KDDEKIFFEFNGKEGELNSIANRIKSTISNQAVNQKLYRMWDDFHDGGENVVREGHVIYKLHRLKERDYKISKRKKDLYFKKYGKLDCEVCGFDFHEIYGEIGMGFIEAHHRVPLSQIDGETETELKDLALVCSNCHRMLHRGIDTLNITELRKLL